MMTAARPFPTVEALLDAADRIWAALGRADWLEAFAAHPKIGSAAPSESGGSGPSGSSQWSEQEQARVAEASVDLRSRLADVNRHYQARFGYIFIVCATGKSAGEMLGLLEARLQNDADKEIAIAANEQRKITRLRLMKLLGASEAKE